MRRATLLGLACWALAAYGSLRVADVPYDSHEACGPWGCLPPVQALAAMHLFWGVLLLPPVLWMTNHLGWRPLGRVGMLLMAASGLAMGCLIGRDLPGWLEMMPPSLRGYWGRRVLTALAVHTDLPLVQLFLAGAVCWWKCRRERRTAGVSRPVAGATSELTPALRQ